MFTNDADDLDVVGMEPSALNISEDLPPSTKVVLDTFVDGVVTPLVMIKESSSTLGVESIFIDDLSLTADARFVDTSLSTDEEAIADVECTAPLDDEEAAPGDEGTLPPTDVEAADPLVIGRDTEEFADDFPKKKEHNLYSLNLCVQCAHYIDNFLIIYYY